MHIHYKQNIFLFLHDKRGNQSFSIIPKTTSFIPYTWNYFTSRPLSLKPLTGPRRKLEKRIREVIFSLQRKEGRKLNTNLKASKRILCSFLTLFRSKKAPVRMILSWGFFLPLNCCSIVAWSICKLGKLHVWRQGQWMQWSIIFDHRFSSWLATIGNW